MNFSKKYLTAIILASSTVYATSSDDENDVSPEILREMQEEKEVETKCAKWVEPYNECIDEGHDKTPQDFEKCLIGKGVDKANAEVAAVKNISKISPGPEGGITEMATIEDLRKILAHMMRMSASVFDEVFANVDKDKVKKFKDLPDDLDYPGLPAEDLQFFKTQGGEKDFNVNEFGELAFDCKTKDSNAVALLAKKKKANSSGGIGNASATGNTNTGATTKKTDESHFSTYKMYYAIGGGVLILAAIGGGFYFMKSKPATEL